MPSEKQYQERKENIASILQHIRTQGPKTRRQLADEVGLSWGCVSELVLILLSQRILLEETVSTNAKGRTPSILTLNPDICFLGIDIEREGLSACVCDLLGRKRCSYTSPSQYSSKEALIACVCDFVGGILEKHQSVRGIGFAIQGIQDKDSGAWAFPAKPPIPVDFEKDLQPRFELPSMIEHDPNCILYGCLDGTRQRKMVLRLGQGVGAAVHTPSGFVKDMPMEFGYLVVDEQGRRMQNVASLDALRRVCREPVDLHCPSAQAQTFFNDMGKYLGIALGNLCNLLQLDQILICGDMAAYYPLFAPSLTAYYEKIVLAAEKAKITPFLVTDAAFGAAKMAMDKFQY